MFRIQISGRAYARASLLLGIGASVAMNVAHAKDQTGPRLTSALIPLACYLSVEMLSRVNWRRGWAWMTARILGGLVVAGVTAVVSYVHQRGLLLQYGEEKLTASIMPLGIDGLMILATVALISSAPVRAAAGSVVWRTIAGPTPPMMDAPVSPAVVTIGAMIPNVPASLESLKDKERKSAAVASWIEAVRQEIPVTPAAIAMAFKRSERWGYEIQSLADKEIRKVKTPV